MSKTESRSTPPNPGFEVEITSGGRAHDSSQPTRTASTLSPARAAAKARARQRTIAIITSVAALFAAIAVWAVLSNPNALVPSDAVTRVNGEYIYDRDITREMDLTRVYDELDTTTVLTPTAPATLENLITTMTQVQDAKKAGITVTTDEMDNAMSQLYSRFNLSEADFTRLLGKYNLTLDDFRSSIRTALLVTKHINQNVSAVGTTDQEKRNLTNEWQTRIAQSARIDRLKSAGSGPAPSIGSEAPDFTLKDLSGKEIKLSDLRGRPVMLNFWATWCPPCRSEIPTIADLYKGTHKEANYEIVGVATQSDDQTVKAFTQEFGMYFPVVLDAGSNVTSLYHVLPIPTSFFIDKDGIIRDMRVGIVDRPTMEKWLLGQ